MIFSARLPAARKQRAQLRPQQSGPVEAEPYGAPAERGILFFDIAHIGQHLVAADVERAKGDGFIAGGVEHRAVQRVLLAGARKIRRHHELQFGAEEPDARGAGIGDVRQVDAQTGIEQQRHRLAILGDAGQVAQRRILLLTPRPQPNAFRIGRFHVRQRPDVQIAGRAVDDDGVAGIGDTGGIVDAADRRNAERARDDRDVGLRAAFLQHQAAQPLAVVVEQGRRPHRARDQDRVLGKTLARRRVVAARQLAHQAIGEVVEIVQPFAQERIGLPQHPRAGVGLDALDGRFRGEAGHHRFFELMHPAAVIGEHAVGFEHVAMLAAVDHVAVFEQFVEIGAQRLDRAAQMLQFLRHVVGDEIGDDDPRLMQHDMAERDTLAQGRAFDVNGAPCRRFGAGHRHRREFAGGDHLRQHHGGGLQRFDFFFRISAPGAVLHDQNAERIAGAQDRHAEERMVDLFAGFRPVREGRMGLGVRQIDCGRLARHQADQAFVGSHHRVVHGVAVEAFGSIELEGGNRRAAHRRSRPPRPCWRRSAPRSCQGVPAR